MLKTFILALFVSFYCSLSVASDHPLPLDSLFDLLIQNPSNDRLIQLTIEEIHQDLFNDPSMAGSHIENMLILLRNKAKETHIARLYMMAGISYDLRGQYDSSFLMYDRGIEVAKKHGLENLLGELYNNYGITMAVLGRLEESIDYTLKAKDIFERNSDSAQLAKIYNNLGSRYAELRMDDLELEYYLKAAAINERRNDFKKLAYNYGNIGLHYQNKNQNHKALEYFHKSLGLIDTVQNLYDYSIALHNLALAHMGLKNYQDALRYSERSLQIATEIQDELGIISALNGMAQIYNLSGQPEKSMMFYNQSEPIAYRLGVRSYLMNIYEEKSKIFATLGDYRNAFVFNQKFLEIKDSVMTIEKDKAVQKIKEFENERKQQEIQLLTKDAEIQKLSLKRQKIIKNSVVAAGILILLLAIGLYNRYRYIKKTRNELAKKNKQINDEKARSEELLLNILPAKTAEELKNTGTSEARYFDMVTVMFTDFRGFTRMAELLPAQELVKEINHCFSAFDQIIAKYGVEKIKTIGDAYMCAGGLPVANETNPVDVVLAAIEIQQFMENLMLKKKSENKPYFELRIGIHTGPVIAGIVGIRKFQYDIWGDTVNIASRMESSGEAGKINISETTCHKIKDRFICTPRGKIEAKNKGAIEMYFVEIPA